MGFLLLLIASILKLILAPLFYCYGALKAFKLREFNEWSKDLATAKDQYGNALGSYFFNDFVIKKEGYKFGFIDETISSVLGKNKRDNTLTLLGKALCFVLNLIDKNHVEKSIENL